MLALTRERLRRGWSKAELARRARLDQGLMSKRRVVPYPRQVARFANALKVSADALMTEVEDAVS